MIHFKAAAFTLVVAAAFLAFAALVAVIWPILVIAALYFVILCILKAINGIKDVSEDR